MTVGGCSNSRRADFAVWTSVTSALSCKQPQVTGLVDCIRDRRATCACFQCGQWRLSRKNQASHARVHDAPNWRCVVQGGHEDKVEVYHHLKSISKSMFKMPQMLGMKVAST